MQTSSFKPHPGPLEPPLSLLLLHSHFDFINRIWSLPALRDPQTASVSVTQFNREFQSLSTNQLSDPAKGGRRHARPRTNRFGIRSRRSPAKPKPSTNKTT